MQVYSGDMSQTHERRGSLSVVDSDSVRRVLVFGDIHGDLGTLKRGLGRRRNGDLVVFLGDYADRGPEGIEVIELIDGLLKRDQQGVIALMGNHESYDPEGRPVFSPATLPDEADRKRGSWQAYFPSFRQFVSRLVLSAVIPGRLLFVHGGISPEISTLEDLEHPDERLREQLLWGDPAAEEGTRPSSRGAGVAFGPDVTRRILDLLQVQAVIRSHEPRKAVLAPLAEHGGRMVTTSSTTVYGGRSYIMVVDLERFDAEAEAPFSGMTVEYLD